jgi:hypothetical protein
MCQFVSPNANRLCCVANMLPTCCGHVPVMLVTWLNVVSTKVSDDRGVWSSGSITYHQN